MDLETPEDPHDVESFMSQLDELGREPAEDPNDVESFMARLDELGDSQYVDGLWIRPQPTEPELEPEPPGFFEKMGASAEGVVGGFKKTGGFVAGQMGFDDVEKELLASGEADQKRAQELAYQSIYGDDGLEQFKNMLDPGWWKSTAAELLPGSAPFLAAAGGAALATAPLGPVAQVIAAAVAGGSTVFAQSVGDNYHEHLKLHPGDEEGAVEYAVVKSGLEGVINAASVPLGVASAGLGFGGTQALKTSVVNAILKVGASEVATENLDTVTGNLVDRAYIDPTTPLSRGVAQATAGGLLFDAPAIAAGSRSLLKTEEEDIDVDNELLDEMAQIEAQARAEVAAVGGDTLDQTNAAIKALTEAQLRDPYVRVKRTVDAQGNVVFEEKKTNAQLKFEEALQADLDAKMAENKRILAEREEIAKLEEVVAKDKAVPKEEPPATILSAEGIKAEKMERDLQQREAAKRYEVQQQAKRDTEIREADFGKAEAQRELDRAGLEVAAEPETTMSLAFKKALDREAQKAATSVENTLPQPTEAQKQAGNYQKGHIRVQGLDIAVENPKGSVREGVSPQGKSWKQKLTAHYGYLKRTKGADEDQIDVFVGKNPESTRVFVVDQIDQQTGKFDEHKVMMGYANPLQAKKGYQSNFEKGWKVGPVTEMTMDEFKTWMNQANTKLPVDESVETKTSEEQLELPYSSAAPAQRIRGEAGSDTGRNTQGENGRTVDSQSEDVTRFRSDEEATEYEAAVAKGLPMDKASRMKRAEAMGFAQDAFHASTHGGITKFDGRKGNVEGDWGAASYTTTSEEDANENYAGVGPDLTNRIAMEAANVADQLADYPDELLKEHDITLEEYEADEAGVAERIAKARMVGDADGGVVYPVKINTSKFAVIGGPDSTVLEQPNFRALAEADIDRSEYDNDESYEDAVSELADQLMSESPDSLYTRVNVALSDSDAYTDEGWIAQVMEKLQDDMFAGQLDVTDIDGAIRGTDGYFYSDNEDSISVGAISAQVLANLGFEGVVDNTVDAKFGGGVRYGGAMAGVYPDTQHIVVFQGHEKNIRSVNAAFDPDSKDSDKILARQGEFYSGLSRAVAGLKQMSGVPQQMYNMLLKQPGVKKAEVEALDLEEFIKAHKGKLTKEQLQAYVDANGIQVEVETLGGEISPFSDKEQMRFEALSRKDSNNVVGNFANSVLTEKEFDELSDLRWKKSNAMRDESKFSKHTLPGGTNYREILLTLPDKAPSQEKMLAIRDAAWAKAKTRYPELADFNTIQQPAKLLELDPELHEEWSQASRAVNGRQSGLTKDNFTQGHFGIPNVLLHLRVNDRVGPNGEKILFIEELQSDWHQQGKKKGYKSDKIPTQVETAKQVLRGTNWWVEADVEGRESAETNIDRYGEGAINLNRLRQLLSEKGVPFEVTDAFSPISAQGVPDAPFKGNGWVELGLKKALRMAAEEGYDTVAWTTGQVQADRYDLSNQIDEIQYEIDDQGRYEILATKDGEVAFLDEELTIEEVEALVGKEMAQKIQNGEGKKLDEDGYRDWHTLTGLDLQVGGEGMKSFYDNTMPNLMKEVARKLDKKASVGQTTIESTEAHSINISPEMKDQAMQGQSLFSLQGDMATRNMTKAAAEAAVKGPLEAMPALASRVNILDSITDAPAALQEVAKKRQFKAVFFKGQIYLFADKHRNGADIVKSLLHEGVAHLGLRALLNSAELDSILTEVYESVKGTPLFGQIVGAYKLDMGSVEGRLEAAEEYIAKIAEEGLDSPLLQRVIDSIRKIFRKIGLVESAEPARKRSPRTQKILHKMGLEGGWTDNDIRALLRESSKNMRGIPLKEITVSVDAVVAETGEVVRLTRTADVALRQIDKRAGVLAKLKGCL